MAAFLLAWAIPDIPWWWRPSGHGASTPAVLGYLALMLAQSLGLRDRAHAVIYGYEPGW